MDTPSVIREYLDENRINAVRSVEIAYRYHAELESGHRIAGCEIIMRAVGDDVFVRAELPISVMTKESRGMVKYLADLNKDRITEGKQGYFDLDYVAGRIVFAIRVRQPITTELLKEVAQYCVSQIEYESDELLKVLCEECEAIHQEEEELRRQKEKAMRQPGLFGSLMRRLKNMLDEIAEPGASRKRPQRGLPGSTSSEEPAHTAYQSGQDAASGFAADHRPEEEPAKTPWADEKEKHEGENAPAKEAEGETPDAKEEQAEDPMFDEDLSEFLNKHIYQTSGSGSEKEDDSDEEYPFEESASEISPEDEDIPCPGTAEEASAEEDEKNEADQRSE